MDGSDLYVISGIDGSFSAFDSGIRLLLNGVKIYELAYDRHLSFVENIENMRKVISQDQQACTLFGWSIGAVAACFLSNCPNVRGIVAMNAFYRRSEVLSRRNIYCEEEVFVGDTKKQNLRYAIIRGAKDNKIPPSESIRILQHYNLTENSLYTIQNANHDLASFPKEEIANIIRNL